MGLRGPKPKPPELKLLEGGRGHRPVDTSGLFRPEAGVPPMPRYLLPEARKAWRRLSAELVRYNVLSAVDREAFAMLCQTIGRLEVIERGLVARQTLLEEQGKDPLDAYQSSTPNGMRIQSVAYQMLNREQDKLHRLLGTFGLRPDARAAVTLAVRQQLALFSDRPKDGGEATSFSDF